jgi:hypothetical protein
LPANAAVGWTLNPVGGAENFCDQAGNPLPSGITGSFTTAAVNTIIAAAWPSYGGTVFGGGIFSTGSVQTVSAIANPGYAFSNWTETSSVVSSSAGYSFTLGADRNLTAVFAPKPFAQWEGTLFTPAQLADPAVSGWNANPRGDGIPNGLKYLFNINPNRFMTATDFSGLPQTASETSGATFYLTLTYRVSAQAAGVVVEVQTSPDLSPNSWATVTPHVTEYLTADPATGDPRVRVKVDITGKPSQFMRLKVTQP